MSATELRSEVYRLRAALAQSNAELKRKRKNRQVAQRRAGLRAVARREVHRKRKASDTAGGMLK
eukprot:1729273-Alexandrium_andersonii.AAC.1